VESGLHEIEDGVLDFVVFGLGSKKGWLGRPLNFSVAISLKFNVLN
jgi:hypothetical protein